MAEPIILALDTSSPSTSIAVMRSTKLLGSLDVRADEKRSERLWYEVQSLLAEAGITIHEVELFSVCVGPGGFTGLRVGVAAVKGLATATGKLVIGVTSLEAASCSAAPASMVCALVNAHRGEVYSQLFSLEDGGVPIAQNEPIVSTFEAAVERVFNVGDLTFAGDAVEASAEAISRAAGLHGEGKWVIKQSDHRLAEDIARLALLKYSRGEAESPARLRACYVRPAEAEIKLSLGLLGSKIKRNTKSLK